MEAPRTRKYWLLGSSILVLMLHLTVTFWEHTKCLHRGQWDAEGWDEKTSWQGLPHSQQQLKGIQKATLHPSRSGYCWEKRYVFGHHWEDFAEKGGSRSYWPMERRAMLWARQGMAKPTRAMYHCQQKDLDLVLGGLLSRKHLWLCRQITWEDMEPGGRKCLLAAWAVQFWFRHNAEGADMNKGWRLHFGMFS